MMNHNSAIAEWKRAQASSRAASVCFRQRCYADAASRSYYAVLHAAKAALIHSGLNVSTNHGRVNQQFASTLVKNGSVEPEWGSEIGSLYGLRIEADYDVQSTFSERRARTICQRAERFLERMLRLLTVSIPFEALT